MTGSRTTHIYAGTPRLVIVESPYAGNVSANEAYLRAAIRDCLVRGEAPFASHALYTQQGVLKDSIPEERELGMRAGLAWGAVAQLVAVYVDLGISSGMRAGIDVARERGLPVEMRRLGAPWKPGSYGPTEMSLEAYTASGVEL